jgi:hypothetical protein
MQHNDLRRRLNNFEHCADDGVGDGVAAVDFCGNGEVSGNSTIRQSRAYAEHYLEDDLPKPIALANRVG